MSDAHAQCEEGGVAHVMGNAMTLMSWPCGLRLTINTQLGRVSYTKRLWEEHEKWREEHPDGN